MSSIRQRQEPQWVHVAENWMWVLHTDCGRKQQREDIVQSMAFVYLDGTRLPMERFAAVCSLEWWHRRPCFQVKLLHRDLFSRGYWQTEWDANISKGYDSWTLEKISTGGNVWNKAIVNHRPLRRIYAEDITLPAVVAQISLLEQRIREKESIVGVRITPWSWISMGQTRPPWSSTYVTCNRSTVTACLQRHDSRF